MPSGGRRVNGPLSGSLVPRSNVDENRDTDNVAAQGGVVAGTTGLSRISGLVRDVFLSYVLGATAAADTFYLAFAIPNLFRRMFAEGAFAQAFVPVLSEYRQERSAAELRRFVAAMAGNLGVVLAAVALAGVLGAAGLAAVFMPGIADKDEQSALATDLTRIMFPYLALIAMTAYAGAVLNTHGRYAVAGFTPVLLNVCLIAAACAAVFAGGNVEQTAYYLAWGVLAAGVAQLSFQAPALRRIGLLAVPKINWRHPGARRIGRLFLPAAFAASAGQINALVGIVLASYLETGSRAWLYYADRLMQLPIGIVAIALGTVLLPNLSRLHATGASERFSATLDWGMRTALLVGVPAAAALALLAQPLVATIFLHGEMRPSDAAMTALALQVFAAGLVPLIVTKIAQPGYFARQDTATPFKFAIAGVAVNIVVSLATFRWLGHVGLASALSIAAFVNAGLLVTGLALGGQYRGSASLARNAAATAAATAAMCAVLWYAVPEPGWWLQAAPLKRIGGLATAVLGGLLVYGLTAMALGVRPKDVLHRA